MLIYVFKSVNENYGFFMVCVNVLENVVGVVFNL